jgi:hypothetical protein
MGNTGKSLENKVGGSHQNKSLKIDYEPKCRQKSPFTFVHKNEEAEESIKPSNS